MRDVLQGEDIAAARDALRALLGTVRCVPDGDQVIAQVAERRMALTGSGKVYAVVAGACYSIRIPTRSKRS